MNLLETIKVSYDQLRAFGAENSYSPAVVKRLWGDKEELSLQEILDKEVHPHLITWTLLRETVFPAAVLHRIALQMARIFIATQRANGGSDVDNHLDKLMDLKAKWLDKQVGDRDLEEGSKEAGTIYDFYQKMGNEKTASQAAVVRDLLSVDLPTSFWKVYYNTIESTNLTRELISNGVINEAWKKRLAFIRNCCEELVNTEINSVGVGHYFSSAEKIQFREQHNSDLLKSSADMQVAFASPNLPYDSELDNELPVGSIIAYAADVYRGSEPSGWLLCDGRELNQTDFDDLFNYIGTAWGSPSTTKFNIPDLRGMFLRSTGGTAAINPDAQQRKYSKTGGNTGDKVGTFQNFATIIPEKPFTGSIANASISKSNYDSGCQASAAKYDGSHTVKADITKGGGRETRPKNKAVHYLIKYAWVANGAQVTIPLAAVFPTPVKSGQIDNSYWSLCDGSILSNVGIDKDLFQKIGFIHGGISENEFLLPDYQDMFLRGVSGSEGNDPDAATRECPYSGAYPGNKTGIGSKQKDETARPEKSFYVQVKVPSESAGKIIKGTIRDLYQYNDGSVEVDLSQAGGDPETSPVYNTVNWLILKKPISVEKFPVGVVIAFGGDTLKNSEVWMPCDGRQLEKDKYPKLYEVLGEKEQGEKFSLPDYSGFFLRGATGDTSIGTQLTRSTTRIPDVHFSGAVSNLPISCVGVSGETRYSGAAKDGAANMGNYEGGDAESRPKNCAVKYYIRVLDFK